MLPLLRLALLTTYYCMSYSGTKCGATASLQYHSCFKYGPTGCKYVVISQFIIIIMCPIVPLITLALHLIHAQVRTGQSFYDGSQPPITYMAIESQDVFDYNVMKHWIEARDFIEEGISKNGRVRDTAAAAAA